MYIPGINRIHTAVVCYTQAAFDDIPPADADDEPLAVTMARAVQTSAKTLVAALKQAGIEVEEVRVPLRGFSALDYSRAALQWRLLTVTQSNGRPIDLAICLDFPAWSVSHPRKVCWVREMPNFIYRRRASPVQPIERGRTLRRSTPGTVFNADPEEPSVIASLTQAEQKGLTEAGHRFCRRARYCREPGS